MNTIRVMSMSVLGERPETTEVIVSVIDDSLGIKLHTVYEMDVDGRYESITDELIAAVTDKLSEAGVL